MIENKKKFIIALCFSLVIVCIELPCVLFVENISRSGWFYLVSSFLGMVGYTLFFISLKKVKIIKKIYLIAMVIGLIVLIMGVLMYL